MSPVHFTSSVTNTEHSAYRESKGCYRSQTAASKLFDTPVFFMTQLRATILVVLRRFKRF